jgi:hypothetical protein
MTNHTFSVTASGDDGFADRESASAGEWPVTGGFTVTDVATTGLVRKVQFAAFSDCIVSLIRFDTSTISDNAVITGATLRLQTVAKGAATGRDIQVGYYASSNWPIDSADWSGADNPGSDAGVFPISGFSVGVEANLALTNPQLISTTGYTGFRLSVSGAEPVLNDDHRVEWAAFDHATEPGPELIVTTADAPTINPDYSRFPKAILRRT